MLQLRQHKRVRVFVWTTFNALITLALAYTTDSHYAFLLIGVVNEASKYVNTNYFGDIGVE